MSIETEGIDLLNGEIEEFFKEIEFSNDYSQQDNNPAFDQTQYEPVTSYSTQSQPNQYGNHGGQSGHQQPQNSSHHDNRNSHRNSNQHDQYWQPGDSGGHHEQNAGYSSGQYQAQVVDGDQAMFVVMDPQYVDPNGGLGEMIVDDLLGGMDELEEGAMDPSQATYQPPPQQYHQPVQPIQPVQKPQKPKAARGKKTTTPSRSLNSGPPKNQYKNQHQAPHQTPQNHYYDDQGYQQSGHGPPIHGGPPHGHQSHASNHGPPPNHGSNNPRYRPTDRQNLGMHPSNFEQSAKPSRPELGGNRVLGGKSKNPSKVPVSRPNKKNIPHNRQSNMPGSPMDKGMINSPKSGPLMNRGIKIGGTAKVSQNKRHAGVPVGRTNMPPAHGSPQGFPLDEPVRNSNIQHRGQHLAPSTVHASSHPANIQAASRPVKTNNRINPSMVRTSMPPGANRQTLSGKTKTGNKRGGTINRNPNIRHKDDNYGSLATAPLEQIPNQTVSTKPPKKTKTKIPTGPPKIPVRPVIIRTPNETFINDQPEKLPEAVKPRPPQIQPPQVKSRQQITEINVISPSVRPPQLSIPHPRSDSKESLKSDVSKESKDSKSMHVPPPTITRPPQLKTTKTDKISKIEQESKTIDLSKTVDLSGSPPESKKSRLKSNDSLNDIQITKVMPPPSQIPVVQIEEPPLPSNSPKPSILNVFNSMLEKSQEEEKPIETYGAINLIVSKTNVRKQDLEGSDMSDDDDGFINDMEEPRKPETTNLLLQQMQMMTGNLGSPSLNKLTSPTGTVSIQETPLDYSMPKKPITPERPVLQVSQTSHSQNQVNMNPPNLTSSPMRFSQNQTKTTSDGSNPSQQFQQNYSQPLDFSKPKSLNSPQLFQVPIVPQSTPVPIPPPKSPTSSTFSQPTSESASIALAMKSVAKMIETVVSKIPGKIDPDLLSKSGLTPTPKLKLKIQRHGGQMTASKVHSGKILFNPSYQSSTNPSSFNSIQSSPKNHKPVDFFEFPDDLVPQQKFPDTQNKLKSTDNNSNFINKTDDETTSMPPPAVIPLPAQSIPSVQEVLNKPVIPLNLEELGFFSKKKFEKLLRKEKRLQKSDYRAKLKRKIASGVVKTQSVYKIKNSFDETESDIDVLPKKRMNYDVNYKFTSEPKQVESDTNSEQILTQNLDEYMKWAKPMHNYTPMKPPPHLGIDIDQWEKFPCVDCGDEFLFERGLKTHYSRKSILIQLYCVQCQCNLQFYNRCQLLRHARMHADQGTSMQFRDAVVKTLPMKYLTATKPVHTSKSQKTFSCKNCNAKFTTNTALRIHYERVDESAEKCKICGLQLPNKCALIAHERYHSLQPPHVCPESGIDFDEDLDGFLDFITVKSCHKYRANIYKAPKEAHGDGSYPTQSEDYDELFLSYDSCLNHQMTRIRTYFQCTLCNYSFKYKKELIMHCEQDHPLSGNLVDNQIKTIFRCPYSEKVYLSKLEAENEIKTNFSPEISLGFMINEIAFESVDSLKRHIREYGNSNPMQQASSTNKDRGGRVPRFKCPLCWLDENDENVNQSEEKFFEYEKDFKDHLNEIHGGVEDLMKTTAQMAKTASLILPDNLLTKFYEREYEAELIRKQKLEEEKMELEKQITDKNTNVQILSDKHSTDVYPCEECDNVFLSAESRKNHVKKIHKEKWQQIENAVFNGPLSQKLRENKEKEKQEKMERQNSKTYKPDSALTNSVANKGQKANSMKNSSQKNNNPQKNSENKNNQLPSAAANKRRVLRGSISETSENSSSQSSSTKKVQHLPTTISNTNSNNINTSATASAVGGLSSTSGPNRRRLIVNDKTRDKRTRNKNK